MKRQFKGCYFYEPFTYRIFHVISLGSGRDMIGRMDRGGADNKDLVSIPASVIKSSWVRVPKKELEALQHYRLNNRQGFISEALKEKIAICYQGNVSLYLS